jgi:hypothetical protein
LSTPEISPLKRLYTLDEAKDATTFTRPTWYRWEKQGHITLVRVGGKTLVPAHTVEDVVSGRLKLPAGGRAKQTRQPDKPRRKGGRPRKHPLTEQTAP